MKNGEKTNSKSVCAPNDAAPYFFHQGTSTRSYDYLGMHRVGERCVFRVWAPNADYVALCGDFTDWRTDVFPLRRVTDRGVWETVIEAAQIKEGQKYKYYIRNGCREQYQADPYGICMETPPDSATVVADIEGYRWRDAGWMRYRKSRFTREAAPNQPINIYEIHAGSWKCHDDGRLYTYAELAADLVTYVKQMGYTHVELMPLAEHSLDGSCGYRICGYFAPSSRYGSPKELMAFVDTMHEAGIGVILGWDPIHDGCCFDVGREEVRSFLISNAYFWVEKYHIDGLRVDAPSPVPDDRPSDRQEFDAVAFFQKLNGSLLRDHPDVMTVATENAACQAVTRFADGGLGFTFQWNMGWTREALSYLRIDPLFRKYHHGQLKYYLTEPFAEHFILPLPYGKTSLFEKCFGDEPQKFACQRVFLTYMMTHPGKKLMFMGGEFGQRGEWNREDALEWFLLQDDMHAALQRFTAELNHFYLEQPLLWQKDSDPEGFAWLDPDNAEQSIYIYCRHNGEGEALTVLLNFTPVRRDGFLLEVPADGDYEEIFSTDAEYFGGSGCLNDGIYSAVPCALTHGHHSTIRVNAPPMGAAIFRKTRKKEKSE